MQVRVPTILRQYTSGEPMVLVEGSTVAEVLEDLDATYPGIAAKVLDAGGLKRFVNVYVDDEDVRFLSGVETAVPAGGVLTILPAVAGG